MRVALTGATGFIGRNVLGELQSRDLDVVAMGRVQLPSSFKHARTEFIRMDLANLERDPFASLGAPDVLIHLAWEGLPNYQSPRHIEIELPAQLRFLDACLAAGLKKLVVAGTCFEYGKASGELLEDRSTRPCTQYGMAKDSLRKQLEDLKFRYGNQLAWLRLFYLYGSGQSKNSLYSLLAEAIRRGDECFDMSGGEQVRDFMPVQRAAQIIVDIALLAADVGVVNVCSGKPIAVKDLVDNWIHHHNSSIVKNLGRMPYSDFEPMTFWGNTEKLNRLLGGTTLPE